MNRELNHSRNARRMPIFWYGLLIAFATLLAAACSGDTRREESSAVELGLITPGERTLSFAVPAGVDWQQALFLANGTLRVNDGVQARDAGSAFALAVNTGTTETNIGVATVTGELWSVAPITLRDRARVEGSIHTIPAVTKQNLTVVTKATLTGQPLAPTRNVTLVARFPDATAGDLNLEPDQIATLQRDKRYGSVTVKARARLTLTSGSYYIDSLNVEADGELWLDKTNGPVFIYVGTAFAFKGKLVDRGGPPENLLVAYFGQSTVFVTKPFIGTIVAPNASLILSSAAAPGHAGSFFAKTLEVHQNTIVTRRPFPWQTLMGGAACSNVAVTATRQYSPLSRTDGRASFNVTRSLVLPTSISVDQGNAGNQPLTVSIGNGSAVLQCTYRGASNLEHPVDPIDVTGGARYAFESCTDGTRAGDVIDATSLLVSVGNGDSASGLTRVTANFAAPRPCPRGVALADLRQLYTEANSADAALLQSTFETAGFVASVALEDSPAARSAAAQAQRSTDQALSTAWAAADQLRAFAWRLTRNGTASPEDTVASALLTFAAEMRWSLGRWSPSKKYNRACPDLINNATIVDLVAGIVTNNRPLYTAALGQAERALQCSPLLKSRVFAEALVAGYTATLARYPEAVRPLARRGLMSGLVNLFLLVHDDTKVLGPTPLYDWFNVNRVTLGQIFAEPNSVPRLAGLWLRHPYGDQLVQIQKLCEVSMSAIGCVSAGHLLDALTDPLRIGLGACTALEMVSLTLNPERGYACERGLCDVVGGVLEPKLHGPLLDRLMTENGGKTLFGVDIPMLQANRCLGPAGEGGGPGGGGAGTGTPDVFTCATMGLLAQIGHTFEGCVLDALAAERTMGSQDTRRTWRRDPCTQVDDGGDDPNDPDPPEDDPPEEPASPEEEQAKADAIAKWSNPTIQAIVTAIGFLYGYNITPTAWNSALGALANADFVPRDAIHADGIADPNFSTHSVDIKIDEGTPNFFSVLGHEFLHALLFFAKMDAGQHRGGEQENVKQHGIICGALGHQGCLPGLMCPMDANCGSCSPSTSIVSEVLECAGINQKPNPIPKGGGVIDPSPETDPSSGLWAGCFNTLPSVPPGCLAVDCPALQTASLLNGQCTCGTPSGGPAMPPLNPCGQIMCPSDAVSVALTSGCRCMPYGGSTPGFPPTICPNCDRPDQPMALQCIAQPQICYFQNRSVF